MGSSARCARVSGNADLASLALGQWAARLAALACRAEYLCLLRSRVGLSIWSSLRSRVGLCICGCPTTTSDELPSARRPMDLSPAIAGDLPCARQRAMRAPCATPSDANPPCPTPSDASPLPDTERSESPLPDTERSESPLPDTER